VHLPAQQGKPKSKQKRRSQLAARSSEREKFPVSF
jgi:hypothetical protein